MQTSTHALPKNSKAWHNALADVAYLLPTTDLTPSNLGKFPIFAVTVVVDKMVLSSFEEIDKLMLEFIATLPKWRMQMVYDDEVAKANAHRITSGQVLADVSLSRYLILPTDHEGMTPTKRDAAARIIDEKLTAFLKDRLEPATPPQGTVDSLFERLAEGDTPQMEQSRGLVDVHILNIAQVITEHKLVCFDMDSTLIEQEVIVELAKLAGVGDKVNEITERAMRGEIDFAQSFAERVALLEGVPETVVDEIIKKHISFSSGAFAIMRALKAKGCVTVLVSGGFEPFAKYVSHTLGMDHYFANPLLVAGGVLTGFIDPAILDGKQKAIIVSRVAERLGIDMSQVVCVGDGANDLPMMEVAGVGIAYRAKPIVQARADAALNITGLEGVIYALGHRFDVV